ncbi:MAG: choice-of-anchor B family protein [Acidobacteria bacterium]|nr:choice-of-anchor B family protein [Acidobacteriota bacterium]
MKRVFVALFLLATVVLVAPSAEAQRGFGNAVAIAGDSVLVAEPANQANPGYVYVYKNVDGEWIEFASMNAPEPAEADGFGTAISADEKVVLISAVNADGGSVYAYMRDEDGLWYPAATVSADSADAGDRFGAAVAHHGDRLIVGAPGSDENWGDAYIFEMTDGQWSQVAYLTGDRPEPMDESDGAEMDENGEEADPPTPSRFGSAVAIAGDWAMVGAPMENQRAGSAYVYQRGDDGMWSQASVLGGDISEGNDTFGSALAMSDHEALVGAPGVNRMGAVRRFVRDGDEWTRAASLLPFEDTVPQRFGSSIVANDDHVYVSAPFGNGFRGVILRYTRSNDGSWSDVTKIAPAGGAAGGRFATQFALAGDTLVAGLPGADFGAGRAVIMSQGYGGWDSSVVISEIKGLEPMTGNVVPCEDGMVGRFGCEGIDLLAYVPSAAIGGDRGVMANDIWGWTDPETDHDYAIVGFSNATAFVDVTEPTNPVAVGILKMTRGARASAWRDIKVHEDHAFIVSDSAGEHGMQVFDLTRLREYDGEQIEYFADVDYGEIASAHNVVINEDSAFAFIVGASGGGETCGGGLHMVNIEDPKNPMFAGCFQDTRTGRRGTGYSHDAQCVIYDGPDERYTGREICLGSNETALSIADVTDKRNPVAVGMSSYPNVAYSHQGWLTDDHRYFYMNDEGDEGSGLVSGTRTIIWDVTDLTDPIVVEEHISDNPAVDHNLYTVGNVMYQSNYDSGLRIFDISSPEEIVEIAYLDTVPFGEDGGGMGGSWSNYPYFDSGIVVLTSMQEGFFIARLRDDARPGNNDDPNN